MEIPKLISAASGLSYAPLRHRLGAFLLDYLLIVGYIFVLAAVSWGLANGPFASAVRGFRDPVAGHILASLTLTLPVIMYFTLSESASRQGTWGKQRLHLRVACTNGGRLTFWRALARSLLKFFPWELAHTCIWSMPGWPMATASPPAWVSAGLAGVWIPVAFYLLLPLTNLRHQSVYDYIAGSVVLAS